MKLVAVVKEDPRFGDHHLEIIRDLPGATVIVLPETLIKTGIGYRVDVVPEGLRLNEPQSLMLRHLSMDDRTQKALDKVIANKFSKKDSIQTN